MKKFRCFFYLTLMVFPDAVLCSKSEAQTKTGVAEPAIKNTNNSEKEKLVTKTTFIY